MNWVGLRVVMDLRVKLFEHLQKLSLDFYSTTPTGEIISRVSNDVGILQQSISNVIEDIVRQPFTLLFVLGYLLKTDWRLTLAALVLFPLVLVPILVYGRKTRKASRAGQESQASLVAVLHESIAGFRVVKAFGMEQREAADFRELCRQFFRQRMRVIHSRALTSPLIEFVAGAGGALVFIYAYQVGMQSSQLVTMVLGLVHALRSREKDWARPLADSGKHEWRGTRVPGARYETDRRRGPGGEDAAPAAHVDPFRERFVPVRRRRGRQRRRGAGER